MERKTPIALAFTPNYFVPAATTLLSILNSSAPSDKYEAVVLLSEELPQRMVEQLTHLGCGRINFRFINLQNALQDIYVDPRYTVAASYRLLLPQLLLEYDKIIYIDCDIIVRNSLAELYHTTILADKYYLAGVFEAVLDFQKKHLQDIRCDDKAYVNSGLLLMNLDLLRKDNIVDKFIEASRLDCWQFPDQDILNTICAGKILGLAPYNNGIRTFFLPQYKSIFLRHYTEEDWKKVHLYGNIHYTGGKPWDVFTVKFLQWWDVYRKLPMSIRREWQVDRKLYFLSLLLTIPGIQPLIEVGRKILRTLRG